MRRSGNIVELSLAGGRLPEDLEQRLKNELQYTHLTALRGVDAYDHLGNYRPTRTDLKILYKISEATGRFNASVGWQYRLHEICRELGHEVVLIDLDPLDHPRPKRFDTDWDRMWEKMELRAKQDEILASLEQPWVVGYDVKGNTKHFTRDHGLVDVPPGVGKTYLLAAYVLAHPWARVHIITDGIDIIHRIFRHLTKYIPNVGMVGGGKCRFGPQVTVISADSLHKVAEGFNDPHSKQAADVVFFDEVHKAGAPTIISQLARYKNCKMYGLSANVGDRFDGADYQLEGIFGKVVFAMSYQEAEALGLVAPVRVEWVKMDFEIGQKERALKGTAVEKWLIWRCDERNKRFAAKINEFAPDVQVLVLVSTVQHAVELKQYLPDFKLCYDQCKDYASYVRTGKLDPEDEPLMTPQRREQMRQQFEEGALKKVIATDVWSTGVDFAALSVVGRADGRDSRIADTQIPGRGNRIFEGKAYATLIDCMDGHHDTLLGRSNRRKRNYIKKGWKQVGLGGRRPGVEAAKWTGV